jgi:DNA-binding transcriptional regulator YiaG
MKFIEQIKQLREERRMPQRQFLCKASANQTGLSLPSRSQKSHKQFAVALEIDTATCCKIEKGKRRVKAGQVAVIADMLQTGREGLLALWLADQVLVLVVDKAMGGKEYK